VDILLLQQNAYCFKIRDLHIYMRDVLCGHNEFETNQVSCFAMWDGMKEQTHVPSSYVDTAGLNEVVRDLHRHLFVLAGPSGVGKTMLATALAETSRKIYVIPNHTTRNPRPTDPPNHFSYISRYEFVSFFKERKFFLIRRKPHTCYGYLKKHINHAIGNRLKGLFMFRHSGISYMSSVIRKVPTVFLEGEPRKVLDHSHDSTTKHSLDSIANEIDKNRILARELCKRGCPVITLHNNYEGIHEINSLKTKTMGLFTDDIGHK